MEKLSSSVIEKRLEALPGWAFTGTAIKKSFRFENFKAAFAAMTRIACECEALNHHPDWKNVYNQLHVALNTHDVQGITEKDFALAEKIEEIVTG